jgi:gluconolactonase
MPSDYEILDRRFLRLINPMAKIERLATSGRWMEGPVYFPAGRFLLWSDVPGDVMWRYDENDGHVSAFRKPSNHSNGNTLDRQGRMLTCEHQSRRVVRTEHDGTTTIIADSWRGKRLNSPNDVVVKSDGSIWFTDPSYGIGDDYQGRRAIKEIDTCNVFRVDPSTGELSVVVDDFKMPNGHAFSPNESKIYIADSGRTEGPEFPSHLRVFDVVDGKRLSGGEVVADCLSDGVFDGLRVDERGNLWVSSPDGIECYDPGGALIGKILLPEVAANCCFGGPLRNRLFMTATTSLFVVYLTTNGLPLL